MDIPSKGVSVRETTPDCDSLESPSWKNAQPFRRRRLPSYGDECRRCRTELIETLQSLNQEGSKEVINQLMAMETLSFQENAELVKTVSDIFAGRWKLKDDMSEVAIRGMYLILEICLGSDLRNHNAFEHFVETLGYHTVFFWKKAVPDLYDSDMLYGTSYREALLFSLVLFDVNNGKTRLRELFAAVPGLRDSVLGKSAKRFREQFQNMVIRRKASVSSLCGTSNASIEDLNARTSETCEQSLDDVDNGNETSCQFQAVEDTTESHYTASSKTTNSSSGYSSRLQSGHSGLEHQLRVNHLNNDGAGCGYVSGEGSTTGSVASGDNRTTESLCQEQTEDCVPTVMSGLHQSHTKERVINVSNAPPVSLMKAKATGDWEIHQGSGGLVSCCSPVMSADPDNMWLACFGPNDALDDGQSSDPLSKRRTNSLGIPLIEKVPSEVLANVLHPPSESICGKDSESSVQLSGDDTGPHPLVALLDVLKDYSKDNFKLNPVVVPEQDYATYYGGISNGLLWPALHNLSEYIAKDYEDAEVLEEHWLAYIRVNYQFALNAVRNCRPQDFIWIHDYHLMLAGMIIRSLDPNLEVGFFLHIPFQPPTDFFSKYNRVAQGILRGILRFTKIGFQTHRDRQKFLELVEEQFYSAKIQFDHTMDKVTVKHDGWISSIGVFPVSIKNEEYLIFVHDPNIQAEAVNIRQKYMRNQTGKFFLSVERFDYTKGIREKLLAYRRYFELYPERLGKDTFLQIAVYNRRSVDTYAQYQDEVIAIAEAINEDFRCPYDPDWRPLYFQTEGVPRKTLVAHYLAANVGVVTPKKDGMNLVAKEILICNPNASLIISVGAGTEAQLAGSGFYTAENKLYHRVDDLTDTDAFAKTFYDAATEDSQTTADKGLKLNQFLMANDIEQWSAHFLDPSWNHEVIKMSPVETLGDFYSLMLSTRTIRRQITDNILKGVPIRAQMSISLQNAKLSLEKAVDGDSILNLRASSRSEKKAHLDVSDEINGLGQDLSFMEFIQSEEFDNVEQFMHDLARYHPVSPDAYNQELDEVITLITRGDHFNYFFTDRDGTLKGYTCSYQSSIQPSFSGVIQATFAHRCTQYAAIVTSAPLMNVGVLDVSVMPDGYFCYGASGGREWYIDASKKFKDPRISVEECELLNLVANDFENLLQQPDFQQFQWIGSGLQRHFGHITVSCQDKYGSVPDQETEAWSRMIYAIVDVHDPHREVLCIHQSDTDIKIYLKTSLSGDIFNKGHGIQLFAHQMELDLSEGRILICGDSESDLPMLDLALSVNPENTYSIFVTSSDILKAEVERRCSAVYNKNYLFVSCPEVILGAMANATIREIKIRPPSEYLERLDYD